MTSYRLLVIFMRIINKTQRITYLANFIKSFYIADYRNKKIQDWPNKIPL